MKSKNLSEKILKIIKSKGFKSIELEPVLESKYILQRSGENFRKFMFSFYDLNGKELCLRPDLTISSVLRYVQNKFNKKKKVCYSGEAYRKTYKPAIPNRVIRSDTAECTKLGDITTQKAEQIITKINPKNNNSPIILIFLLIMFLFHQ